MNDDDDDKPLAAVAALVSRLTGGWTLVVLWPSVVLGAPLLGVPFLGCGALLAAPGVAMVWLAAAVIPADYRRPLGQRLAGGVAMASGALVQMGALLVGLGETRVLLLAVQRGHPVAPSLELGAVAVAVLFSAVASGGGFALRWGLHPAAALVAGAVLAAAVPASCGVLAAYWFAGLPLSA